MKHLWILLLTPLLFGAVSVQPVELEPAVARLGEPLTLGIQLPAPDWELTGYPDLTPFQLLDSPHYIGSRVQLRLLPLRSGEARIPRFSFYRGNLLWQSPALTIDILDPFADVETVAPRLPWPDEIEETAYRGLILAVLFTGLALGGYLLRQRKQHRPDRLTLLSERLAQQPDSERRSELAEILSGWRFGPYRPTNAELERLEKELAKQEGET